MLQSDHIPTASLTQESRQYSQLDPAKQEIRLLSILPGYKADAIYSVLETRSLDDSPDFEALSYTWGDPDLVEDIFLNNYPFKITLNLSIALRHLRNPQTARVLWIDALCINQLDIQERNHQVGSTMGRIYSSALRVLVWLGEANARSNIAMDLLQDSASTETLTSAESLLVFDALLTRPWWERLWVVQEVVLAHSDPIIGCGDKWVPWETLFTRCTFFEMLRGESLDQSILRAFDLNKLRQQLTARGQPKHFASLIGALAYTVDYKVKDPRDRIYGCLGWVESIYREAILPDYEKAVHLVYWNVAKYILEEIYYGSLFSSFSYSHPPMDNLPSWVPEFGAQNTTSSYSPLTGISTAPFLPHLKHVSFYDENRVLRIAGIAVGTIETSIELKTIQDGFPKQIVHLEHIISSETEKSGDKKDLRSILQSARTHEPVLQVLLGGDDLEDHDGLRSYYKMLASQDAPTTDATNSSTSQQKARFISQFLPGRHFFITNTGFIGVAAAKAHETDIVSILYGEKRAIILRPHGAFYTIVGAAYVSGLMANSDEIINILLEHRQERLFDIR